MIRMNKLEWEVTPDGYIKCDLGFIKWEIHINSCSIYINESLWHEHDTVEGAKIMVENRMREFISSLIEVSNEN